MRGLQCCRQRIARRDVERVQPCTFGGDGFASLAERGPAGIIHQAQFPTNFRQAQVGVVLAQLQPVFGARGKHAIRLLRAVADQVVDQHADIGLVATRRPWRFVPRSACGVEAGDQALSAGFLVAGGAVDLAGKEQTGDRLGFQ